MAVAIISTDSWIQHLPFVGGPRPSEFGPVDGVWYGLIAGDGAAGGGNFTISGNLSFDRKEDWVYILGGIGTSVNTATTVGDGFTVVNTGPLIPTGATATTVNNPSFPRAGSSFGVSGNSVGTLDLSAGGKDSRIGMPIFGDKKISGTFLMIAAGWQVNIDGATYQLSSWGFLIRYNSFFRLTQPARG